MEHANKTKRPATTGSNGKTESQSSAKNASPRHVLKRSLPDVQQPLHIGESSDEYEQQAHQASSADTDSPIVTLRPVRSNHGKQQAPKQVKLQIQKALSGGQPLPNGMQVELEQRFDADLSNLKVHTSPEAQQAAHQLNANAFAVGSNVLFGQGRFQPQTQKGRSLIAHEVAHTLQQNHQKPVIQKDGPEGGDEEGVSFESDEEALEWAKAEARSYVDGIKREFEAAGSKAKDFQARKTKNQKAADEALKAAKKDTDEDRRLIKVQFLSSYRALWNDEFYVFAEQNGYHYWVVSGNRMTSDQFLLWVGKTNLNEQTVAKLKSRAIEMAQGGEATIFAVSTRVNLGKVKDYQGDGHDVPVTQGGGDGADKEQAPIDVEVDGNAPDPMKTPHKKTSADGQVSPEQNRKMLDEMLESIGAEKTDTVNYDVQEVADALSKLSEHEKALFLIFLEELRANDPNHDLGVGDALFMFRSLSEAQIERLRIYRDSPKQIDKEGVAPAKEMMDRLDISAVMSKEPTKQLDDVSKKLEEISEIDQIRGFIRDENGEESFLPWPKGWTIVFDEVIFMEGMLAGASTRSPEIHEVSKSLFTELDRIRKEIMQELAIAAGETALLSLLTAVTEGAAAPVTAARIAVLVPKLKRLRDNLQRLEAIFDHIQTISEAINTLRDVMAMIPDIRQKFDTWRIKMEDLEKRMEDLEASENLDDELADIEEKLISEGLEKLQGEKWGELMSMMYLPEDADMEELMNILLDMPRGFDALQETYQYYSSPPNPKPDDYQNILILKAFHTGQLLYPIVGLIAGLAAEELASISPSKTMEERIERLLAGPKSGKKHRAKKRKERKKARKEKNEGKFRLLGLKEKDFAAGTLKTKFDDGYFLFKRKLAEYEPSWSNIQATDEDDRGHWSPTYFRYAARKALKEVNREAKKWRAPLKKDTKEMAPIPKFKISFAKLNKKDSLKLTFKINPEESLVVDEIDYSNFAGTGIKLNVSGKPKRRDAIEKRLDAMGYKLFDDPAGKPHIRHERGGKTGNYLHVDEADGRIKQGIYQNTSTVVKRFLGKRITESDDLPEGYHLKAKALTGDYTVARKLGLKKAATQAQQDSGEAIDQCNAPKGALPALGLDANGKLKCGKGGSVPKELAPAGVTRATSFDSETAWNWQSTVTNMFNADGSEKSGFKTQGWDQAKWLDKIENHSKYQNLKKRPTKVEGYFGYLINARALSDLLSGINLPELKNGDDKGHLVAKRFYGDDHVDNLVPMDSHVNQKGVWYKAEDAIAKIYKDGADEADPAKKPKVKVTISLTYPHGDTRRPSVFQIVWNNERGSESGTKRTGNG